MNKNVVTLTDQELRNATYWGPFIKSVQYIADADTFWSNSGIFSANDHRRMLDHEFISELAIAFLHGPQNKKDKLDNYYQLYEAEFENKDYMIETFRKITVEITRLLPDLSKTRWKKKSDFYTLFLQLAEREKQIPLPGDRISGISKKLIEFGERVDSILRLDEDQWKSYDANVVSYARNVARAASDRASRVSRATAFSKYIFNESGGADSQDPSFNFERVENQDSGISAD